MMSTRRVVTGTDASGRSCVITSYSIHYTKLYDPLRSMLLDEAQVAREPHVRGQRDAAPVARLARAIAHRVEVLDRHRNNFV